MKCLKWRSNRHKIYLFIICVALFLINRQFIAEDDKDGEEEERLTPVDLREEKEKKETCPPILARESKCIADNGKPMKCWKDDEDVYFPFSFVKKRFDMNGKNSKDGLSFDAFTSYSKMRVPDTNYDPTGPFGHFSTYSVETRDRVRCISAKTDVPMSTQWDPIPYYYPIQIAQYGLQHFSKIKAAKNESQKYAQIVLGEKSKEWKGGAGADDTTERLFYNDENVGKVVNITADANIASAGAYVYLDKSPDLHVVSFEWRPLDTNASFTILAKMKEDDMLVLINYVFEEGNGKCVWSVDEAEKVGESIRAGKDGQISFSYTYSNRIGNELETYEVSRWSKVSRNVLVDVSRALSSAEKRRKDDNVILHPGDIRLISIGFRGKLSVRQKIVQSSNQHEHAFESASDWLVQSQDESGGWSVPVERAIADRKLVLAPGWHSAMAQGHAISLLTRAYGSMKKEKYLMAAIKAIDLFKKNSSEGGVRAEFFGNPWYEEYPTNPSSFVLNGFLYSLIGLYDLSQLKVDNASSEVLAKISESGELYRVGIESLKRLLPLFDTGSGTIYDLRHVGLGSAPNLARWDYHAVHVYLLKWIAGIENNDIYLNQTSDRWIGYANGKRAKHN